MLAASRRLNQLFRASPDSAALDVPLSYADRLRIRLPGDATFALGPHADGGSLERWEDPTYRATYAKILAGRWRDYDPFDLGTRPDAQSNLYDAPGGCSVLRSFQGWMSMSETGPGEGTLKVYPGIRYSSAYTILRPFFKETAQGVWELDLKNSAFPGSAMARAQEYDGPLGVSHPHLELAQTMTSMPKVQPGDASTLR